MIILRQREFSRKDYLGLVSNNNVETLKQARTDLAKQLLEKRKQVSKLPTNTKNNFYDQMLRTTEASANSVRVGIKNPFLSNKDGFVKKALENHKTNLNKLK